LIQSFPWNPGFLFLILVLTPWMGLASEPEGQADVFPLSEVEEEWAQKILPSLGDNQVIGSDTKHCFGQTFLPKHMRGERWNVAEVLVEAAPTGESHLVLIWFYPVSLAEGPRHYPRSKEVIVGLLALAKDGNILAFGKNILTRESDQTMGFLPRISLPKLTLWGLEEITRFKGVLTRNQVYFRKSKKKLIHAGTIPTVSTNLGLCGSFKRARAKKRGLAGTKKCPSLWHFETTLKKTKKGLRVSERFTLAKGKRYKAKTRERTVTYQWTRGRLKGNRKSLRQSVPALSEN